jgi:hypothetical protein
MNRAGERRVATHGRQPTDFGAQKVKNPLLHWRQYQTRYGDWECGGTRQIKDDSGF